MLYVVNVKDYDGGIEKAVSYIHGVWGMEDNYLFYKDAIYHSSNDERNLPQFYLLIKNNSIVGCVGLIVNDFISRHDLFPWLSSLYIEKAERGNNYAQLLMEKVEDGARKAGYEVIYLTTEHEGYYEKYGWERIEDGIDLFSCNLTRIYSKKL